MRRSSLPTTSTCSAPGLRPDGSSARTKTRCRTRSRSSCSSTRSGRAASRRSPDIVGQTIRVNGRPYGVVGVAEPGFHGSTVTGTDMWMPFAMAPHITGRTGNELLTEHGAVWHLAVARLKPGVSMAQARDELNALFAPLKEAYPDAYGRWAMAVLPSARIPGEFRTPVASFVARPLHPDRHGADDCVHERRRHAAGAGDGAAARDGDAPGSRRQPNTADGATARRDPGAVRRGGCGQPAARLVDGARDALLPPHPAAAGTRGPGGQRPDVRVRHSDGTRHRPALRARPGAPRHAGGPCSVAARSAQHQRSPPVPAASPAGRRAGGAVAGAAGDDRSVRARAAECRRTPTPATT